MLETLITLTKSLAEKLTNQKLKEIIIYCNINVGDDRKIFLVVLEKLNMTKAKAYSVELSKKLTKLSKQSDVIFTHFPNNLGFLVKMGKNTRKIKQDSFQFILKGYVLK